MMILVTRGETTEYAICMECSPAFDRVCINNPEPGAEFGRSRRPAGTASSQNTAERLAEVAWASAGGPLGAVRLCPDAVAVACEAPLKQPLRLLFGQQQMERIRGQRTDGYTRSGSTIRHRPRQPALPSGQWPPQGPVAQSPPIRSSLGPLFAPHPLVPAPGASAEVKRTFVIFARGRRPPRIILLFGLLCASGRFILLVHRSSRPPPTRTAARLCTGDEPPRRPAPSRASYRSPVSQSRS
ncbi:hypothetical protein TPAR_01391 [Tolypocladium paradoxum]|uniref:Uncharacterized protein n=1 Tax=Tolypocladium paradoxum TaxID=94208 RepID=A0A2S4L7M1_9HYPO|nr:hypothetical protein TPAR_01391 [Tolypocladium paradoxum]